MVDDLSARCARCGRQRDRQTAPAEALAWVVERDHGTIRWLCPVCVRRHVRDIEGKVPSEHW